MFTTTAWRDRRVFAAAIACPGAHQGTTKNGHNEEHRYKASDHCRLSIRTGLKDSILSETAQQINFALRTAQCKQRQRLSPPTEQSFVTPHSEIRNPKCTFPLRRATISPNGATADRTGATAVLSRSVDDALHSSTARSTCSTYRSGKPSAPAPGALRSLTFTARQSEISSPVPSPQSPLPLATHHSPLINLPRHSLAGGNPVQEVESGINQSLTTYD
jgi:hypothetical protein